MRFRSLLCVALLIATASVAQAGCFGKVKASGCSGRVKASGCSSRAKSSGCNSSFKFKSTVKTVSVAQVCTTCVAATAPAVAQAPVAESASPKTQPLTYMTTTTTKTVTKGKANVVAADDPLAELNARRAQRGLHPYTFDPLLAQAATTCAQIRAANRIHGHLPSDFAYLPPGGVATATGCGALTPDWGFASCCMWDNYQYAGAARVRGDDGRDYCHIFCR